MALLFEHCLSPTDDELAQVRHIIETNFEPVMQKPFCDIIDGTRDDSITLLVARDSAPPGHLAGIATLTTLTSSAAIYLGYLAVETNQHNQGIGGALFRFMVDFVQAHTSTNALVWEVEAPHADPGHINNRRIRFYERLGGRVITAAPTYRMPDDQGGSGTIPLRLMWLPVRERTAPPSRAEIAAWISDIFRLFYPDQGALLAQLIAELVS